MEKDYTVPLIEEKFIEGEPSTKNPYPENHDELLKGGWVCKGWGTHNPPSNRGELFRPDKLTRGYYYYRKLRTI